jgi:hypothetical protein
VRWAAGVALGKATEGYVFAYIGRLSREQIGDYSAILAVICAGLFLASWLYLELGFTIDLLIWFFLFFGAFHSWAAREDLTQAMARKIDYWYLGVAAFAALAASAALPIQRSDYELKIPIPELNEKEIVQHVSSLIQWVLRITKTTIEVFGWTDRPASSADPSS